jgi:hypothetical protein
MFYVAIIISFVVRGRCYGHDMQKMLQYVNQYCHEFHVVAILLNSIAKL